MTLSNLLKIYSPPTLSFHHVKLLPLYFNSIRTQVAAQVAKSCASVLVNGSPPCFSSSIKMTLKSPPTNQGSCIVSPISYNSSQSSNLSTIRHLAYTIVMLKYIRLYINLMVTCWPESLIPCYNHSSLQKIHILDELLQSALWKPSLLGSISLSHHQPGKAPYCY